MASTTVQREVEEWVREVWLGGGAGRYGVGFSRRRLRLVPGGEYQFDAVSGDGGIVGGRGGELYEFVADGERKADRFLTRR